MSDSLSLIVSFKRLIKSTLKLLTQKIKKSVEEPSILKRKVIKQQSSR